MRIIIAILLASGIAGCAALQARQAFEEYASQFPAKREAWAAATKRLDQMCKDDPANCRMRPIRLTAKATSPWESRLLPPYRVIVGIHEEEFRQRTQVRLADEYVLGVSRMVAELADDGKMGDEEVRLTIDRAFEQGIEMIKKDISVLRQSYQIAQQQDQASLQTFAALVNLAAIGLNMYVATMPPRVRTSPPASLAPTGSPSPIRAPVSTIQCTYRLNALAGMMLCVNSDGSVVAR